MRSTRKRHASWWSGPLCALLVATGSGYAAGSRPAPYLAVANDPGIGVTVQVSIPRAAMSTRVDADGFRVVEVRGLRNDSTPGRADLPVIVAGIAIPEGATIDVEHDAGVGLELRGAPVRRVPAPDGIERGGPDVDAHPAIPAPSRPRVTIEEFRLRGLRVARLRVEVARVLPEGGAIAIHLRQTVRVRFVGGSDHVRARGGPLGRVVERLARRDLLNGAEAFGPAGDGRAVDVRSSTASTSIVATFDPPNPGVRIGVDRAGLVRITRSQLEAIGFDPAAVNPRNLEVYHRGVAVPCRVTGEQDASFDVSDVVEFYAIPADTRFAADNVYWLEEQSGPGLRFAPVDATPGTAPVPVSFAETVRLEDGNSIYTYGKPAVEGEPRFFWVWFEDSPAPPRTVSFSDVVELVDLDPASDAAALRASFLGRTDPFADPDHAVRMFVNGTEIGMSSWNGLTWHTADVPFSASLLVSGANTFRIDYEPVTFPDIYYMDWYEVEYPRRTRAAADRLTLNRAPGEPVRFEVEDLAGVSELILLDVSDPMRATELQGWTVAGGGPYTVAFEPQHGERFLVAGDAGRIAPSRLELDEPSALRDPSRAADLLVIVPEGWEDALAPLVDHRRSQGLRVELASLRDVADEFAGGNVDDVAIRDAVRHAYREWQPPALSYVLLVGEANRDPRNYLEQTPHHYYMPTHHGVTSALGETTTDTWFGAVDGDDLVPDVAVGRLSVRSPAEALDRVTKILGYEQDAALAGPWRDNVLLIASNEAQFEDALEDVAATLPAHVTVDRQYRRSGATASSIDAAFESGAVLASFLGHGNVTFWADSPGGSFYDNDDVAALANGTRLPFVTAFNCINGFIAHPTVLDSMEEVFADRTPGGAVGAWSTSALGVLSEFEALETELYETVYGDRVIGIGDATLGALVETYLGAPVSVDLLKKMILLGDPSGWLAVDTDGDGLLDRTELDFGLDPSDRDTDDDGRLDAVEGQPGSDADGDGRVNALDPDSDDDGLFDGLEVGLTTPDIDTDTDRGFFTPDADPGTTTDPFDPDSDGGGAPDGAEDRDANGRVDLTETDPRDGADDAVCDPGPVPEVGANPGEYLEVRAEGSDLVLTWGDLSAARPCLLYRVYVADSLDGATGKAGFTALELTGRPTATVPSSPSTERRFVVVGYTLISGEGPWGHFE